MAKLCQVCAAAEAKYKCPGCRAPYCSAACYKAHKETPCAPAAPAPANTAAPAPANSAAPANSTSKQAGASQPSLSALKNSEELVVDATQLLSIEQLGELKALPIVHKSLESPAIRELLAKIDSSGDRLKELEKALLDPAFASFMFQTLDDVAAKTT